MGDPQHRKKQFASVAGILGFAVTVLLVYLLWPGSSRAALEEQQGALQQQFASLNREVKLWESSNPEKTRADLKVLYGGVPSRESEISQRMEKLTQENGVSYESIKYSQPATEKAELPGVQRIKIDTTITGDYVNIARFINAMEQDPLLFVIKRISLSKQQQGRAVSLQISFDTFLKGAA